MWIVIIEVEDAWLWICEQDSYERCSAELFNRRVGDRQIQYHNYITGIDLAPTKNTRLGAVNYCQDKAVLR